MISVFKSSIIDPFERHRRQFQFKLVDAALYVGANVVLFLILWFGFDKRQDGNLSFVAINLIVTLVVIGPARLILIALKDTNKKLGHIQISADLIEVDCANQELKFETARLDKIVFGKDGTVGDVAFKSNGEDHTCYFTLNGYGFSQLRRIMEELDERRIKFHFIETPQDKP